MGRDWCLVLSILAASILTFTSGCIDNGSPDGDEDEIIEDIDHSLHILNKTVTKEGVVLELLMVDIIGIDRTLTTDPINTVVEVNLSLKVSYIGSGNWTGTFPSACRYNFVVRNETEIVWNWGKGKGFAQIVTGFYINQSMVYYFNETWRFQEKDQKGGIYAVEALFVPVMETVTKVIEVKIVS